MAGVAVSPEAKRPDSGTEAHCVRVATIATELALRSGLESSVIEALRSMALDHHALDTPLSDHGLDRLIQDLGFSDAEAEQVIQTRIPAPLRSKLPPQTKSAIGAVALANLIDEALEALPYYPVSFEQILGELRTLALEGTIDAAYVEYSRPLATAKDVERAIDALPVFPAVALQVITELQCEDASLSQVERLAMRDQVLAGALLNVANSYLYGARREIRTLTEAISRVGTAIAAQVVIATSLKPLIASANLRDLWCHSTTSAAVCSGLAVRAGNIGSAEAGVLGLVHDIGRLVVHTLPREHAAAHTRIAEASGCPVLADYLVFGRDHAELGADVLARWNFPVEFVEAVGFHHQPEGTNSRLGSMLYVAEYLTGSEEDIPSISRLAAALDTIGVPLADCLDLAKSPDRLESLLDAA